MPDQPENPAPQMNTQQSYPPPQYVGVPPSQPRSNSMKIVLIIGAVFIVICLICGGIVGFGIWRATKSMHRVSSDTFTASDLGIAIYPGATPSKMGMRMQMGNRTMINAFYLTPDSTDQVTAFYKDKAGPNARITTLANVTRIHVPTSVGGESVTVEIAPSTDGSGNKTRINIVRVSLAAPSN